MKKIVAAAAAFLAAVAPCSMFFASIEPVRAAAAGINFVTLTAEQTYALFGTELSCDYRNSIGELTSGTFSFYGYSTYTINTTTKDCVVYKSDFNDLSLSSDSFTWLLNYKPTVNISNITGLSMYTGYRVSASSYTIPNAWAEANKFVLLSDAGDTDYNFLTFYMRQEYYNGSYKSILTCDVSDVYINPNTGVEDTWLFTYYPVRIGMDDVAYSNPFSVKFYDDNYDMGMFTSGGPVGFDGSYYYIFIGTPTLTDTYVIGNNDSSSGGSDSPDYSGDLQDILDKLDAIIANGYVVDGALDDLIDIGQGVHGDLQGVNSRLDNVNSNLNKIDSHIQALQIPDLLSQSSGDMSHIAQNESKNNSDLRAADANQQVINSVAGYGDVSLPNLDNVHSMPDDFSELWNYTDQDGLSWVNPILYAMPILTLTVGALAYIVFGRAR